MAHNSGGRQEEYSSTDFVLHWIDSYQHLLTSTSDISSVLEVGNTLDPILDSSELCGKLACLAATKLRTSHAFVHLAEAQPVLAASYPGQVDDNISRLIIGFADRAINRKEMIVTPQLDMWFVGTTVVEVENPFQAVLSLPLEAEGRIIGALTVGSLEKRTFSSAEADLLSAISVQASTAVLNALRMQRLKRHAELLEAINMASSHLLSIQDETKLFESICSIALGLFSCQCACIVLTSKGHNDGKTVEVKTLSNINCRPGVQKLRALARTVVRQAEPVVIRSEEKKSSPKQLDLGIGCDDYLSTLAVPLHDSMENLGALILLSTSKDGFDGGVRSADIFAGQVTSIIKNNHLLAAERQKEVQKEDLLSNITHDLRTPLSSIKGYSQLLSRRLKDSDDARLLEMLNIIDSQASEMASMISQIQDLARIDKGVLELNQSTFDALDLVKVEADRLSVISSQHEFKVIAEEDIYVGNWDKERVRRVVANLISNAVKYSPRGGEVVITVKRRAGNVVVSVADKGIGIAAQHLNKIFRRYYRVSNKGRDTYPGMGLGLNLSNEIIKAHGGRMWVESEVGKGSTFYFSLPSSKAHQIKKVAEEKSDYNV